MMKIVYFLVVLANAFDCSVPWHFVGSYEVINRNLSPAYVTVSPNQNVSLILASDEPVSWHIQVPESSKISEIILSSYHCSEVILPYGMAVPVYFNVVADGCSYPNYFSRNSYIAGYLGGEIVGECVSDAALDLPNAHELVSWTKLNGFTCGFQSLQSTYRAKEVFKVGCDRNMPSVRKPIENMQECSTEILSEHKLTVFGRTVVDIDTVKKCFKVKPIHLDSTTTKAVESVKDKLFVVEFHSMYEYVNGTRKPVIQDLSWLSGIAWDTRRQRILTTSFSGEGFFYAWNPSHATLERLNSLNEVDLIDIAYDEERDVTYGLGGNGRILVFDAEGSLLNTFSFDLPLRYRDLSYGNPKKNVEIHAKKSKLYVNAHTYNFEHIIAVFNITEEGFVLDEYRTIWSDEHGPVDNVYPIGSNPPTNAIDQRMILVNGVAIAFVCFLGLMTFFVRRKLLSVNADVKYEDKK